VGNYFLLKEKQQNVKPSVLSTLLVENFFSTVQRKVRYPSLYKADKYAELRSKFGGDTAQKEKCKNLAEFPTSRNKLLIRETTSQPRGFLSDG